MFCEDMMNKLFEQIDKLRRLACVYPNPQPPFSKGYVYGYVHKCKFFYANMITGYPYYSVVQTRTLFLHNTQ